MSEKNAPVETVRQEVEIKLGGKTYLCRPTFESVGNIEARTGQPCKQLGMKAMAAGLGVDAQLPGLTPMSLAEAAVVIFWMLRGQKGAPESVTEVGDLLMDEGMSPNLMALYEFLTRAHRGNAAHAREAALGAPGDPPKKD